MKKLNQNESEHEFYEFLENFVNSRYVLYWMFQRLYEKLRKLEA
jgi:hypothetical protein